MCRSKDSTKGSLEKRVSAGYVLSGDDGWSPVDRDAARKVAAVPGVRTTSSIRQDAVRAYGQTEGINAVDPATIGKVPGSSPSQACKGCVPARP